MPPRTEEGTRFPLSQRLAGAWRALKGEVAIADPGTPNILDVDRIHPLTLVPQTGQNKRRQAAASKKTITPHEQCRNLAEACEPLRLMIETRKDQLCKHGWSWVLKKKAGEGVKEYKARSEASYNVEFLNNFFKKPDKIHIFQQWLRMVLEEIIVIDDLYIYKRPTMLGEVEQQFFGKLSAENIYSLQLVDGATINKMVDYDGQLPQFPDIAFQQIINGKIVADFTVAEMFNFMRNPRVNHSYGYSPVEQTIYLVNMALRRATMQLSHYTHGNMPPMLIGVPQDWSADEIGAFQSYWDTMVSGNATKLAKGLFVPGGMTPILPQQETLKDDFDEYIIRMFAYALSVSPTSLVKSLNRASAEQQRDQADEEGMQVWTANICALLNTLIEDWFNINDCEIRPSEDRSTDPLKQAQTDKIYIESGVDSIDEIRERNGKSPIGVGNIIKTGTGIISLLGDNPQIKFIVAPKEPKTEGKPFNGEGVL